MHFSGVSTKPPWAFLFYESYLQIHANEYARRYYSRSDRFIGRFPAYRYCISGIKKVDRWEVALFRLLIGPRYFCFSCPRARTSRVWSRARGRSIPNFIAAFSRPWLWTIFFLFRRSCILLPCAISRWRIRQTAGCIRQISHVYSYRHS